MFLAVRDGVVVERSDNEETLLHLDSEIHAIVEWDGPAPYYNPETCEPMLDPRNSTQKEDDVKQRYKRQRRRAMPTTDECLVMIYRDMKNGTTEYIDTVDAIHAQFPARGGK